MLPEYRHRTQNWLLYSLLVSFQLEENFSDGLNGKLGHSMRHRGGVILGDLELIKYEDLGTARAIRSRA